MILCGGAFNSPQLLQLSGVGDAAAHLGRSASTSCDDLPAVGRNLQDHLEVYIQHSCRATGVDPALDLAMWKRPYIGVQWLLAQRARVPPITSRPAASCAPTTRSRTPT